MKEEGNKKKILALVVSLALCLSMIVPLQAATKPVAKKTITVTINEKIPVKWYWVKAQKSNSKTKVSIKIDKVKGKPSEKKIPYLIPSADEDGMGSLVYDLKPGKYKKGAEITGTLTGDGHIEFDMPKGVSSVTYKVTFQSSNKKKTILNVQASDPEKTPKGYEWGKHEK